jgi:predicted unusual protein kinase regulating ubiquinone biosynthesis (AarF/ABC1/UbiB family)
MPAEAVREIVSRELRSLGRSFDDVFASFDDVPLGSASVAQARAHALWFAARAQR